MRVLLLHPEDSFPSNERVGRWDLIVDFARAPASTYERWSTQTACPIISIYDFAKEIDDLRFCKKLLQLGMGCLVDRYGIDWWDVLSLGIVASLLQFVLLDRLAKHIGSPCELHATRLFPQAEVLRKTLSCTLGTQGGRFQSIRKQFRHYAGALANLDAAQLSQVIQDKFDRYHAIRRGFSRRGSPSSVPVILLPSAYVNVSRMAARYAELLPEQQFLLVLARRSGQLQSSPSNVRMASLDPYFGSSRDGEARLCDEWRILRQRLVRDDMLFDAADRAGMLERVTSGLTWGLRVRDAWLNVLDMQPVVGCLCADDTNPYTRIPLLLVKNRGIPIFACHHGALDSWMALKTFAAGFYLAKSEMERDYLIYTCNVDREKIVLGAPVRPSPSQVTTERPERSWMVFFTEPYEATGWRSEEVYRDLLPHLCSLAQRCGLKLVFKLHPFESIKGCRKNLRRILGQKEPEIEVIAGPLTNDLWGKIRFALTVESSTALECAAKRIPVFLCTWLRDAYSGYVRQFAKFGVGHALESPEQIADIPHLLSTQNRPASAMEKTMNADTLHGLFLASDFLPSAINS